MEIMRYSFWLGLLTVGATHIWMFIELGLTVHVATMIIAYLIILMGREQDNQRQNIMFMGGIALVFAYHIYWIFIGNMVAHSMTNVVAGVLMVIGMNEVDRKPGLDFLV